MKYFKLPDLGEGLAEAEIVAWHVKAGDQVSADQLLVSVETAKAIVDIPSPQAGKVAALFGNAGDIIHVGEPMVEFVGAEDDSGTVVGKLERAEISLDDHFIIGAAPSSQASFQRRMRATPAVRALAKHLGVDLQTVKPGADGLITAREVERTGHELRSFGEAESLRGVRRTMARTMAQAHVEVVPVSLFEDADIHAWPAQTDITMRLLHAMTAGCQAAPALNAWFDGHQPSRRLFTAIHVGIAVDTGEGLFVPVLKQVESRASEDLRDGLDKLRADVRKRTIPPAEMQGATISLSNFGTIAGRYANPVVVPPQVCIIGAGKVREEPRVLAGGKIAARRVLPLSLTFDHRAATGGEAARFLKALVDDLEKATTD